VYSWRASTFIEAPLLKALNDQTKQSKTLRKSPEKLFRSPLLQKQSIPLYIIISILAVRSASISPTKKSWLKCHPSPLLPSPVLVGIFVGSFYSRCSHRIQRTDILKISLTDINATFSNSSMRAWVYKPEKLSPDYVFNGRLASRRSCFPNASIVHRLSI